MSEVYVMKIFIGSSREATRRDAVTNLAIWLEDLGQQPIRWDQPGLFLPGHYLFTRLLEIGKEVDAAILVFSDDDKLWYQKELGQAIVNQPRDNVLLEYGLFAGILGPEKVIVCREGMPRNPSDLGGIIFLDFSPERLNLARTNLKLWVEQLAWGKIKRKLEQARTNPRYPNGYRTIKRLSEIVNLPEPQVRILLNQHRPELIFDEIEGGAGVRLRT
jgi:predicted nucleotide-binding protein